MGSGGRLQTCLLLRGSGGDVLVDCGASSLIAMKRAGIDPSGVKAVLLTHLHGDHFGGLPFLVLDGQFSRRARPLRVGGPPGVAQRVRAAMEVFFPGSSTVSRRFALDFVEFDEREPVAIGPVTVTPYPVVHASGAPPFALRVACDGKVVTYSGDTEWTDALVEAARGADIFVCEAYTFNKPIKFHLDFTTLRAHRARIDCPRIILTHMSADMLPHREETGFEYAADGLIVTV